MKPCYIVCKSHIVKTVWTDHKANSKGKGRPEFLLLSLAVSLQLWKQRGPLKSIRKAHECDQGVTAHTAGFPTWAKQNFPHSAVQQALIEQLPCRPWTRCWVYSDEQGLLSNYRVVEHVLQNVNFRGLTRWQYLHWHKFFALEHFLLKVLVKQKCITWKGVLY